MSSLVWRQVALPEQHRPWSSHLDPWCIGYIEPLVYCSAVHYVKWELVDRVWALSFAQSTSATDTPCAHTHTATTTTYKKHTHNNLGPFLSGRTWLASWITHTHTRAYRAGKRKKASTHAQQTGTITYTQNLLIPVDTWRLTSCSFEWALGRPFVQTISKRNRAC